MEGWMAFVRRVRGIKKLRKEIGISVLNRLLNQVNFTFIKTQ